MDADDQREGAGETASDNFDEAASLAAGNPTDFHERLLATLAQFSATLLTRFRLWR